MRVTLPNSQYTTGQQVTDFFANVVTRVSTLPSVRAAAAINILQHRGSHADHWTYDVQPQLVRQADALAQRIHSTRRLVGPRTGLRAGRPDFAGITAGVGIETHVGRRRLSPSIRFTHWAAENPPGSLGIFTNEVVGLAVFVF